MCLKMFIILDCPVLFRTALPLLINMVVWIVEVNGVLMC
jgi:hypothetical protein